MHSPTEQDLLNGAKNFDLSILEVIYDRFSARIYRYALRLLGDSSLAEDCVSETFLRYLKALRAGQGPKDHLQAYLYRIAHNWITDYYRRQPSTPLEMDEHIRDDDHLLPDEQTRRRLEQEKMRLALRSLTPDQRQIIILRFIEGWGTEEVAISLQKPAGAIRAMQLRAINSLRTILEEEDNEDSHDLKR